MIKNIEESIYENIVQYNSQMNNKINQSDLDRFHNLIQSVKTFNESKICNSKVPISKWSAKEITKWSQEIKNKNNLKQDNELVEILTVLNRAVEINSKHKIRDVQFYSILFTYCKDQNHGRLLQVLTGEGKSQIISCLAVLLSLSGKCVDIVTSSEVLAKRDSEEKQSFYSLFDLKCSHNIRKEDQDEIVQNENEIQECYSKEINIVYGTAHTFQADILKHEFYGRGNRGQRQFDYLIIDEVDSMFVDSRNHRTLISSEQSGFQSILIILQRIWMELCRLEHRIDPKTFQYTISNESTGETIEEGAQVHLCRTIINFIGDLNDDSGYGQFIQPFFLDYINHKLSVWADNALKAKFRFKKNKQYIVSNDMILPIDYQNTGVTQNNTQYSDGIQQFLQLKENVTLTNINLITNYSSNVGFFRRYKSNLYGLTGTLGSECIRGFLQETYNTNFAYIPPFKKRLLKELNPIIQIDRQQWMKKISSNVEWAILENQRCCLVICQTIQDVYDISSFLKQRQVFDPSKMFVYMDSNDISQEQKLQNYTNSGCVIISTNLAGRGTDLKISEKVERNGGLHVILTFQPANSRVKEQAFGRAGRMGQNGTSILIINQNLNAVSDDILDENTCKYIMEVIQKQINVQEKLTISEAKEEVKDIVELDELFSKFSQEIQNFNLNKQDSDYHLTFKAFEFRFGLFLDILSEKQKEENNNKSLRDFEQDIIQFFKQIREDYANGKLVVKPQDMLLKGFQNIQRNQDKQEIDIQINKAKISDKNNPIPHYLQMMNDIKEKNFNNISDEFKQFSEKIALKKTEHSMLEQTQQFCNEIAIKEIQEQLKIETKVLEDMKVQLENPLSNVKIQTNFENLKIKDQHQIIEKFNEIEIKNIQEQLKIETKVLEDMKFQFQPVQSLENPLSNIKIQTNSENLKIKDQPQIIEKLNLKNQQIKDQPMSMENQNQENINQNKIINQNNFAPVQLQQNENKFQINDKNAIDSIQKQQYKIIQMDKIKKQELLVKDLNIKLNTLLEDINLQKINISHDKKQIQFLDSLEQQMKENIDILNSANGQKNIDIKLDFEQSTSLKQYMTNPEAFKNVKELQKELENQGIPIVGKVRIQKKKRNWLKSLFVIVCGIIQIVVGAAITYFSVGAGSQLGISLIVEGAQDVYKGVSALINNEDIDLKEYFKTKVISLSLACVLSGVKALSETSQLLKKGVQHISQNGLLSSTKSFLSKEVIFGGLKKASIKALELKTASKITGQVIARQKLEDIDKDKMKANQNQFKNSIQQIKNGVFAKKIVDMQEKESKFKKNLQSIQDQVEQFVGQQIRKDHFQVVSKLAYLQQSASSEAIEKVLNIGYNEIDYVNKDNLFQEIINILSETIFDINKSVSQITPKIKNLLNQIFNNINKLEWYSTNKNSINIYKSILEKVLKTYPEKKQKQLEETIKNKKQQLEKQKNIFDQENIDYQNYQKQVEQEFQSLQQQSKQFDQFQQNLEQIKSTIDLYSQQQVNNFNNLVEQQKQRAQQFNSNKSSFETKQKTLENKGNRLNQLINEINQSTQSFNSFVNDQNNTLQSEMNSINNIIKNQNFMQNFSKIFSDSKIFEDDDLTINLQNLNRNRETLKQKLYQLFQSSDLANEIISYIQSSEFSQEQVKLQNSQSIFIDSVVDKTNEKIISPLLHECLNRLLSKDVQLFNESVKNFSFQQEEE